MICAHCGHSIERDNGSWVHANGWTLCDPRAYPLTHAAPHPACLPDLGTHADLPDPVHGGDVFSRIDASQEG
jgi:hypothetical protein